MTNSFELRIEIKCYLIIESGRKSLVVDHSKAKLRKPPVTAINQEECWVILPCQNQRGAAVTTSASSSGTSTVNGFQPSCKDKNHCDCRVTIAESTYFHPHDSLQQHLIKC